MNDQSHAHPAELRMDSVGRVEGRQGRLLLLLVILLVNAVLLPSLADNTCLHPDSGNLQSRRVGAPTHCGASH